MLFVGKGIISFKHMPFPFMGSESHNGFVLLATGTQESLLIQLCTEF